MIEGVCSSDRVQPAFSRVFLSRGCECDSLPIPLLYQHDRSARAGWVTWLKREPTRVRIRASIDAHQHEIWCAIQHSQLRCLSIGAKPTDFEYRAGRVNREPVTVFSRWALEEVSIVDRGANPEACFVPVAPRRPGVVYLDAA